MDLYIKQLVEAFDFNSVKKQKSKINAVDVALQYIRQKIDNREELSQDEYDILTKRIGIYKVSDHDELKDLIEYFTEQFGNGCTLNWIDVSNVTDMISMFANSKFNGDISQWDVSNVTNMNYMFSHSKFTGDISQWDVSNVTSMYGMFKDSVFNEDLSKWDVSNVTGMDGMFYNSIFNGDISQWDVSNVTDMSIMFSYSEFTGDISQWDVSKVIDKRNIITRCPIKKEYKKKKKK